MLGGKKFTHHDGCGACANFEIDCADAKSEKDVYHKM
jgi:hypothetical protein